MRFIADANAFSGALYAVVDLELLITSNDKPFSLAILHVACPCTFNTIPLFKMIRQLMHTRNVGTVDTRNVGTVDVLKIRTLFTCQKGLNKQCGPRSDCFFKSSLIWVFTVCYSGKHFFVKYSADNHNFI